jgi:DNA-directed RNA polymerase subunit RPC12/RpoP
MATINFRCKKCGKVFDFEVGKIVFGKRLSFENEIKCENCGVLTLDEIELTEWGQTQVSELFFKERS